jgi:cytochrome P450
MATTERVDMDLFTNNERFGDLDTWRRDALALHSRGPVHRIETDGYDPFWAVIGHGEVMSVERRHTEFTNQPFPILAPRDRPLPYDDSELQTLISMDDPEHGKYRKLTADWFKPASVRRMNDRLDELSRRAVARLEELDGEADFYRDIAMSYPLQVILSILGLPEDDYGLIFKLTQEVFGSEDPDLQRGQGSPEETLQTFGDLFTYFTELIADRQAKPTDDLATLIANAEIDGQPAPDMGKLGYYLIIATAGHDTTASAMAGGLRALAEHPDQLDLLRSQPELIPNAVDEMLRWTAPVRHFMRTARADNSIGDVQVTEGDWVYLSYLAANLDPRIFEDPLRFDVTRSNADHHIAFGYGVHFCLGAQLARLELRSLFTHLIPRLTSLELAGDAPSTRTTFVGGHKAVPIRYTLS